MKADGGGGGKRGVICILTPVWATESQNLTNADGGSRSAAPPEGRGGALISSGHQRNYATGGDEPANVPPPPPPSIRRRPKLRSRLQGRLTSPRGAGGCDGNQQKASARRRHCVLLKVSFLH